MSDYQLPQWNGLQALRLVRDRDLDVPFIIVSGTIGEDLAVEAMRHGADDYLLKDRLSRLGGALTQALERKRLRAAARKAAEALRDQEAGLRQAQQVARLAHAVTRSDGSFESWSESLPMLIGMDSERMPKSTREWLTLLHPDNRANFRGESITAGKARTRVDIEYRLRRGDGAWRNFRHVIEPLEDQADATGGTRWFNTVQDVTEQVRNSDELRESEARFRSLTKLSSDWYWEQDAEYRFTKFSHNDRLRESWGGELERAIGLRRWELPGVAPVGGSWDEQKALLEARKSFRDLEYQRVNEDGTLQFTSASGEPVFEADGRFAGYRGVATDITLRKREERELERFRMAMDVSLDTIYLTDPASMRFVYLNNTACERLGYSRERLLQMGPQDVLSTDLDEIRREYEDVIASGDQGLTHECPFVRSDGSKGWTELHRRALRTEGGTLIVSIGRDITDRRHGEEELRASETRFRQTFELAASGMAHVSLDGRLLRVNRKLCEILGYSEAELIERPVKDVSHPDDREVSDAPRARLRLKEIGSACFEKRQLRKDGAVIWVSHTVALARDAAGEPEYEIAVFEDVTERKAQQGKIERLNRVYAVLSEINALIVRVRDRDELFKDVCRIAVEAGGFVLAWVGVVNREEMCIRPAAWHGCGGDYIQLLHLGLSEADPKRVGLGARAVIDRKAMVANDMTGDPRVLLKEKTLERGVHSLATLPLLVEGEAVGVLALYASEVGFFDAEEMKLLNELAGDISFALDHIEKAKKLDYLAFYDSLTGLANRTLFLDRLNQCIHAAAQSQSKFALVLADVERLRTINESLGRNAGDALLKQVTERLARAAGRSEVGRVSADQFAVILPAVKGRSEADRIVQTLVHGCFDQPFEVNDAKLRISAKTGIALHPNDGGDAETLLKHTEAALRKGKETGERFAFYTPDLIEQTAATLTLENKLRQALENEEFVLHYQPKVDLESRGIVGMEALIRWQSPELGLVPPLKFIPLMEETGMILEVGAWALARAVADHSRWMQLGLPAPRVAVNVSPIQLRKRDFVSTVEAAIRGGASPPGIDLEITESLVMEDIEGNIQKLKDVRALGIGIAVDDFGTGYSSLGYLAKLPVQSLKIDRSFIITMLNDPDTMALVQMIISLAHSLRLKVVAEGVDSEEQAKFLRLLRCDEMQGYLFSRPVPFDQMTALLKPGQVPTAIEAAS